MAVSNTKVFKGILEKKTFKQIKFWKKEIDLRKKLQKNMYFSEYFWNFKRNFKFRP